VSGPVRRSPLHDLLVQGGPRHSVLHGMAVVVDSAGDAATLPIMLTDASCLPRMGVKGPQAEAWLRSQGVSVPEGVNAWSRTADGMIVARLARSEFFLEDRPGGDAVERCRGALTPAPGLYPVLRQDAALGLAGLRLNDLLVQTCNADFRSSAADGSTVVMTSMVGVSVLALWDRTEVGPVMRIWCDGTFGSYLWETLLAIAREEGGGPVGLGKLFPDMAGLSMAQERGRP
jgi:sarcosine oxidase, subunit gamma